MAKPTMSTVDKALALLRFFSVQHPELGLSELARLAGHDKTTTLRCLTALERNGFVEQDAKSRKYRLGLAPINLAQIREQSFPVQSLLKRHLDRLSEQFGETAHAALLIGRDALTAAISEPDRALRVHVDPWGVLPLHATASGVSILAHMSPDEQAAFAEGSAFESFTSDTPKDAESLEALLERCRSEGVSRALGTFEAGVIGTAAPFFGQAGKPIGSIAVASVASRLTPERQEMIDNALKAAAFDVTHELGGVRPE